MAAFVPYRWALIALVLLCLAISAVLGTQPSLSSPYRQQKPLGPPPPLHDHYDAHQEQQLSIDDDNNAKESISGGGGGGGPHRVGSGPGLNFSSAAPHLFASTRGLLQQWANTVFPNGHAVAPCRIPAYTLLYHGRRDADAVPPSPEWLAFDPEMAYGIMGSTRDSWLLTFQTTRSVPCLYFDGASAALQGLGQLDSQMLFLYGNISGPPRRGGHGRFGGGGGLADEYDRASGLCAWLEDRGLRSRGWGFEAVVRMNAGFEVIWCDFASESLRLISRLNVTAPLLPGNEEDGDKGRKESGGEGREEKGEGERERHSSEERAEAAVVETSYYPLPPIPTRTDKAVGPSDPPAPPNWRWDQNREPFLNSQGWGWFDSATWHYGSSRNGPGAGETRARIISCGILSYYSPRFVNQSLNRAAAERKALNLTDEGSWKGEGANGNRTLALAQLARRRRYHHLGDVTPFEAELMRNDTERVLRMLLEDGEGKCTGADWTLITAEIVQRTTSLLKILEQQLGAVPPSGFRNQTAARQWIEALRSQEHAFMVGFLEYPPADKPDAWSTESKLFNETLSLCRYRYTRLMAPVEGVALVPEEDDQRRAVEETFGTICRVLLGIGFQTEASWSHDFNKSPAQAVGDEWDPVGLRNKAIAWTKQLQELIAWLGWESEFIGCKEVCDWDERCYIPMWPLIGMRRGRPGGPRWPPRNGTYPYPHPPPPEYGIPHFPGPGNDTRPNGTFPAPPGFERPPRGPERMSDDTDLWEPRCVKAGYIMGGP